ncbi:hypothetical protein DP806_16560 [Salmonella enterica subsp. enterica serovar Saintpaul]|nr:hypothetical protein [Salmonella enterica subsp. enterica serovar Saintpaul]
MFRGMAGHNDLLRLLSGVPFFSPDGCGMPSLRRRFSAGREQVQGMRRNLFHACGKKILPKAASLRPLQLGAAGASLPSQ